MNDSPARFRALLTVGLLLPFSSCDGGQDPGGGGGAGEAMTGGAGAESGRGGSANGGTTAGGNAGDDHGGGTSQGGTGAGQDGSAGDGVAAAGGQDNGDGTVTGVVTTDYGSPNPNVLVAIGSRTTYTDANGRFEVPNVAPEYDIAVIAPAESYALVIRGISSRTLSLRAPGYDNGGSANVAGVVTGGAGTPVPRDCYAGVAYRGTGVDVFDPFGPEAPLLASDASYSMDLFWHAPVSSVAGFLHAIEYRFDEMNRAISYEGFGSTPLDLSNRGMYGAPATTIALAPVASRTVSGTVTVPSGYLPRLYFNVGPFGVNITEFPDGHYSAVLPTGIDELENTVTLQATLGVDEGASLATYIIDDAVTTLDLSTPAAPVSLLPPPATAGVDYDTEFGWDPPADSVSVLTFSMERWTVRVVTDALTMTIPDLGEYGVTHSPGSAGGFWVQSDIGPTSVEEWVTFTANPAAYLTAHGKIARTVSSYQGFTLAE